MSSPGPIAKLQRSFGYRLSKWFPSEMVLWMDRVSDFIDNFVAGGGALSIATVLGATNSLKSTVPTGNVSAIVDGVSARGDGGGGEFFWDGTYAGAANDITIVRPTAVLVGAWFRIYSGPINVLWANAKGDGTTDDHAAILAAIAIVPTTRGMLYFPGSRNYKVVATSTYNFQFTSFSDLLVFSDGEGASITLTKDHGCFLFDTCTGVEVKGLQILGTIQADGGDPLGGNNLQHALVFGDCTNVNVHDNIFQDLGGYGVFLFSGNTNCSVHDNDFLETMAGCQTGSSTTNSDLSICDNFFKGFIPTGGAGTLGSDDQIAAFGVTKNLLIRGNIIDKRAIDATSKSKAQARCIDVTTNDAAGAVTDVIIENNICLNSGSTSTTLDRPAIVLGVDIGSTAAFDNVQCRNNIIRSANCGIQLSGAVPTNVTIQGNQISSIFASGGVTAADGISVSGNAPRRIAILDNDIDTVGVNGINILQVTDLIIARNHIKSTAAGQGMFIQRVTDLSVLDNHVYNPGAHGIFIGTAGDHVKVAGNTVLGGAAGGNGITLQAITDALVLNNICRNSTSAGMAAISCVGVLWQGNECDGNSTDGLLLQTLYTEHIITGNRFHGNTGRGLNLQGTNCSGIVNSNWLSGNTAGAISDTTVTSNNRFGADNPNITNAILGNDRGTVSITGINTTSVVAFPVAEPDANYFIELGDTLSGAAVAAFSYITNKTANGFTINISAAPAGTETHRVDWFLTR